MAQQVYSVQVFCGEGQLDVMKVLFCVRLETLKEILAIT